MKTFLIVGIESVVGANLAATWCRHTRVVGVSPNPEFKLTGCERAILDQGTSDDIINCLRQSRASHVVFCGSAACSSWETRTQASADSAAVLWAAAAAQEKRHFTMISSDAVFTGPWMFHDETSVSTCPSTEATEIRRVETRVREECDRSLIVRTNAFGWGTMGANGWLESILSGIEGNRPLELDPICHATPILASDLADYLTPALDDELSGVFHIAGAERVNPHQFARQLASAFEVGMPATRNIRELSSRPTGFGRGESSLQTRRFRCEYECAMPLLSEGLTRLAEQHRSGYRERLSGQTTPQGKAA